MQLTWDVDRILYTIPTPAFDLGSAHFDAGLPIRYYGLLFALLFLVGIELFSWQVKRAGGSPNQAYSFLNYALVGVIFGSRLVHVVFYDTDNFLERPMMILEVWKGGLASHGGTTGLILAAYLWCKNYGQSLLETCDRLTFAGAFAIICVRLGNLFNSEIVGRVTNQNWGVRFPQHDRIPEPPLRHPSQVYELILGVFLLVGLWLLDKKLGGEKRTRGVLTGAFFIAYFGVRMGLEFFKEFEGISPDSFFTMGQYLSLPAVAVGAFILWYSVRRGQPAEWAPEELPESEPAT